MNASQPNGLLGILSLLVPGLGQWVGGRRLRGFSIFSLELLMLGLLWWITTPSQGFSETSLAFRGNAAYWGWIVIPIVLGAWNVWDAAAPPPHAPGWVPTLLATLMFIPIGWEVTQVDLTALTQNAGRMNLVLGPMLQPDFIKARAEDTEGWVVIIVPCPPEGEPLEEVAGLETQTLDGRTLTLSTPCASVGETVSVTAAGFRPDEDAALVWQSPIGDYFPLREPGSLEGRTIRADAQGRFTTDIVIPNAIPVGIDPTLPQDQRLYVRQSRLIGGYEFSTNGNFVLIGIYQSIAMALMATTLGMVFAIPISFLAARNLMGGHPLTLTIYVVARAALNVLRSIESLIFAIVFVTFVGLGPFAGMLAVTLHTIAALGKLYSEVIEGIDPGPLEAMQATGANWFQIIRYGVIPQIVPPFTAFTIYRWEINVRASTVIGLVGGGGIGFFLIQWINLGDYRAVGATFLAILLVVMIMDFLSARIRARLI
jgi:phosphonate transport system permease protein